MIDDADGFRCQAEPPTRGRWGYGRLDEEWFEIEPRHRDLIQLWLDEHPGQTERLIPLLHHVQQHIGHLPFPVQQLVGRLLGLSAEQVYGVVSFYNFFTTTPRGKYQLKVCTGTACFVKRSERLLETIQESLRLAVGEVTDDLLFSVDEVRCIGACGLAPAVMVNAEVRGNMAPVSVQTLIDQLRGQARAAADNDTQEVVGGKSR